MRKRKVTGSTMSLIGVFVSMVGAFFAWYGNSLSGRDAKNRAEALAARSDELAAKSEEIAGLNRQIADLAQKYAAYVMGADSYIYVHVQGFGQPLLGVPSRELVKHVGSNPVRDTEVLVFEITDQIADAVAGRLKNFALDHTKRRTHFVTVSYPGRANVLTSELLEQDPQNPSYGYFINLASADGIRRQILQLVKVGDEWKQAYYIERVLSDGKLEPVGQYFDQGFPTTGNVLRPRPNFPGLP